ncbi:DUF1499 domain-containing protein [Fulvimarina endophytica]|uniref:DUF1499 domain-containing protein n=1 Tax=Fulvimarina endophytica TaxID=2293836 RepID=A0A371X7M6_9HYPH|nr:DUF1499 domain-containing protein [Fulvimarina endophytica]RFC65207.1 DUF1499 domain-containing protein [Fulvimarina endophytica]
MSRAAFSLPPQGHFVRPRLGLARPALRMAWFGILLFPVSVLAFRLGGVTLPALFASLSLSFLLLFTALVIASAGLVRAWVQAARGGSKAFGAAALASIGLIPFAIGGILAAENPPTNVAYTIGLPARAETANANAGSLAVDDVIAALPARRYAAQPVVVAEAVETAAREAGFTIEEIAAGGSQDGPDEADNPLGVFRDSGAIPLPFSRSAPQSAGGATIGDLPARDDYRIQAVAADWLLGLPSTVTIAIELEGSATVVDIRSASPGAPIDFGQNRRFIEDFYAALDLAMASGASVAD